MDAVVVEAERALEDNVLQPAWLPFDFDWRNPDYVTVWQHRARTLCRIVESGSTGFMFGFYAEHPIRFIIDWGCTFDPRNAPLRLPTTIPFVLFPRQVAWLEWVLERWRAGERGLSDKSRGFGVTWMAVGLACTLSNFFPIPMTIGFGSRKAEYVDKKGDPKSIFWRARMFMDLLPALFKRGWNKDRDAPADRIMFPATGSVITGEAGDGIGRGDRTALYFVDEAAFLEHPEDAESSLSDTTNCRIDISTPNGPANAFAERRRALPPRQVFTCHWRDDPRRDEAWYEKKKRELPRTILAREYECNYSASIDFVVIPSEFIEAAIDAHLKLGISPSGTRRGALDVADQGIDLNAYVGRHGFLLNYAKAWSGQDSDIFATVQRTFGLADEQQHVGFLYDADGVGAGVRGDARILNETRRASVDRGQIADEPFQGSGAVYDPLGQMVDERTNEDFFANLKAQCWWHLRILFQNTYRAVVEKMPFDPDQIISLDGKLEGLPALIMELGQPIYKVNTVGKIVIEKTPEGAKSPNLGDAAMMCFSPVGLVAEIWAKLGRS